MRHSVAHGSRFASATPNLGIFADKCRKILHFGMSKNYGLSHFIVVVISKDLIHSIGIKPFNVSGYFTVLVNSLGGVFITL